MRNQHRLGVIKNKVLRKISETKASVEENIRT
jgi:hypothetical protein